MAHPRFKLTTIVTLFLFSAVFARNTYAINYDCSQLTSEIASGEAPSPLAMVCIAARVLNIIVLVVGIALVVMILWGALKMSTALGDPKGVKGGHDTWTYAAIGAGIVVGVFAIYSIIAQILGLPAMPSDFLLTRIETALIGFLNAANIVNY